MPILYRTNLAELIRARALQTPQQVLFTAEGDTGRTRDWTAREIYARAKLLSDALFENGYTSANRVGLLALSSPEWVLVDSALLLSGIPSVPLYPTASPSELTYILRQVNAPIVFASNRLAEERILPIWKDLPNLREIVLIDVLDAPSAAITPPSGGRIITLGDFVLREHPNHDELEAHPEVKIVPQTLATVVYTSGTAGPPKGVLLSHANLTSALNDAIQAVSPHLESENERMVTTLPFAHIFGRIESYSAFCIGATLYFPKDESGFKRALFSFRPTILFGVPRIFEKILLSFESEWVTLKSHLPNMLPEEWSGRWKLARKFLPKAIESIQKSVVSSVTATLEPVAKSASFRRFLGGKIKFLISGGAPLKADLIREFSQLETPLLQGYGLTETAGPVTLSLPTDLAGLSMSSAYGSVGAPLHEVNLKVSDEGEIWVSSPKVFETYLEKPAETEAALVIDREGMRWFKTGDLGYLDQDRRLFVTGRKSDLIVTSTGKKVAPEKIESLVQGHPHFEQLIVVGEGRPYLSALITLKKESVHHFASENLILFSGYHELLRHPKVTSWIQREVDTLNQGLASFETVRKFILLSDSLSPETGELTASHKLRRRWVEERFRREIESLYS